ncbi:MAG: Bug family tripartite tricarboxylate transporter substrate binding protein [Burkholderiaceae bacterium]
MNYVFCKALKALVLLAALIPATAAQAADDYPTKPIRLVVPFPPGGGVDITARVVAAMLSDAFKHPTVVENKTGAVGAIGYEAVARAAPDGYTLLMGSATPLTVLTLVKDDLPYKLSDYAPVSLVSTVPHVIVVPPSLPPRNLNEFVEFSRKASPPLVWGSPGVGTVHHMAGELFFAATGVQGLQVPYRGSGQMMPDLLAGRVQAASLEINSALPHINAGTLRALGIASAERSTLLPDLPTMGALGLKGFEVTSWFGLMAPKGTPPQVVAALAEAIQKRVRSERFIKTFTELGATPVGGTPEEFSKFIRSETDKWAGLIARDKARAAKQ